TSAPVPGRATARPPRPKPPAPPPLAFGPRTAHPTRSARQPATQPEPRGSGPIPELASPQFARRSSFVAEAPKPIAEGHIPLLIVQRRPGVPRVPALDKIAWAEGPIHQAVHKARTPVAGEQR